MDQEFTASQLNDVWADYSTNLKNEERTAEYTILNQPFEIKEKDTILLRLANSIQVDLLERFKMDFVQYLRQSLKNSRIKLQIELTQEEQKQRLYTSQDKFNYMAEKNPKLAELKRRLNLDYDY